MMWGGAASPALANGVVDAPTPDAVAAAIGALPDIPGQTHVLPDGRVLDLQSDELTPADGAIRIGFDGVELDDAERSNGLLVLATGESALVAQPLEDGMRVLTVNLLSGAQPHPIRVSGPPGATLEMASGGAAVLQSAAGDLVGVIAKPWARDSAGRMLPTAYTVTDSTLTQAIDFTSAVFPVVSAATIFPRVEASEPYPFSPTKSADTLSVASSVVRAAAVVISPAGCRVQADYPHKSTHVPGTINGVGRVLCNTSTTSVSIRAQLWETRWYGWEKIGTPGYKSGIIGSSLLMKANGWDDCRAGATYRVSAYGTSNEGGRTYSGEHISTSYYASSC